MLLEIKHVRQIPGEGYRRWFSDDYFDLYLWYNHDTIDGFQLCYNKNVKEHSITWQKGKGFLHNKIDDGETQPQDNKTPILIDDGTFDNKSVADRFIAESKDIDKDVSRFVYDKLLEYSDN
jgi:hypothetical protein